MIQKIKENRDFHRAYRRGKCAISPALITYAVVKRGGGLRVGITTSKKIGGAVQRNRARRVIRAAVRALNLDMNRGYDIIFVARSKTTRCKSWQLEPLIKQRLTEAGVINAEETIDISDKAL